MGQIESMRKLGMTEEEIADLLECDKRIDKGEKLFELTPEQEKASKTARATTSMTPKAKPTKTKVENADKKHLMKLIETAIGYNPKVTEYTVVNAEREATFEYNGVKYKITLSCPRT